MKPSSLLRKSEAQKREVCSAALAAGFSVAFGSPTAGVLFSLGQLLYYFPDKTMWQSFVSAVVAAVKLQPMNLFWTGKLVLHHVKYTRGWHDFEMMPFAVLGVLGECFPPCGLGEIRKERSRHDTRCQSHYRVIGGICSFKIPFGDLAGRPK